MKEGWEVKNLGDVCRFQNGFAFKSKTFKEEGTPVVRITNIQNEVVDISNAVFINRSDFEKDLSKYEIYRGDLLIAMSGATTGKIGEYKNSTTSLLNQRVGKFEPLKNLYKKYLYYFLCTKVEESLAISAGAAQPNLSTEQIKSFQIPIPPLPEQKQIVAILDKAFAAIDQAQANIEKNIENAKELFQSKLNAIFSQKGDGWEEKTLGDIGEVQTGTTPSTKDKSNYGDYIPFAKPPHFKVDGRIDTQESMLSKSGLSKGRLFKANSVLMVCIGATIGKTGFSEIPISSNQQINALTPNSDYVPKLLYYALISPFVQNQVMAVGKSAQATLPIINKSKWLKLKVNLPIDKSVQTQIIETLENLMEFCMDTETIYQQKLTNLEDLKKSLLQKAFSGELTVLNHDLKDLRIT